MAFCQNCGNQLAADAKFCSNCGTPAGSTGTENVRKQLFINLLKTAWYHSNQQQSNYR